MIAGRGSRRGPARALREGARAGYDAAMNPRELPVYQQRAQILDALAEHQVIVVESPTGSGKTTQIPVILHEAGYTARGVVGITQPRRIATLSVSDFIARQLGERMPGLVGYKMRFEDKTEARTRIKIVTDGMLLQEMKLDPMLSRYSAIMVDEAHERSLNIDFILGLLKRVIEERKDFRVVVSSATLNTRVFSEYFGECPIVSIETPMYPVQVVYDPVVAEVEDALPAKVEEIIARLVSERRDGDVLAFLSGERAIKDCMSRLEEGELRRYLHVIPLYSRLGKEEQERVFERAPFGKTKVVLSTNIAETSVTIDGITSVIDSGLSKLNYYNPRTFTSSLVETPISKASCNQRKGRAGRTRPGSCYRLFTRKDFEQRSLFTVEEIFRTDLSEVVLRMAELGIKDFESFDFISKPGKEGIMGAIDALSLLDALDDERNLSSIGKMMCAFPLLPRHSRCVVEAILSYPSVVEETITAAAFLSTQSPYVLPPGEELEARRAHHAFRDPAGDFVSYLRLLAAYRDAPRKDQFCERSYLDERAMREIMNVKEQLELIVSDLGVPIGSGGPTDDYLCAVSRGLIQYVCARTEKDTFRSLTADRIIIHPGSVMFRQNPQFIVAGEVVKTTRMYAMSVSPLAPQLLGRISPRLEALLRSGGSAKEGRGGERERKPVAQRDFTNQIRIGKGAFKITSSKEGRKLVILPWEALKRELGSVDYESLEAFKDLRGAIRWKNHEILPGEKLELILKVARGMDPARDLRREWPRKRNFSLPEETEAIAPYLAVILALTQAKGKGIGFVCLLTDGAGQFWFKPARTFHNALNESVASLEALIDLVESGASKGVMEKVNDAYRRLSQLITA